MISVELAVLFDLDGLLVDTEPLWGESADLVLGRRGYTWDRSLRPRVMGRRPLEVARFMVEHYALDVAPETLMEERLALQRDLYRTRGIAALPGAVELVEALHAARVPMAVASGSPTFLVEQCLEGIGLGPRFVAAIGADRVGKGKPAPDVFLAAAAAIGAAPRCCVVLEDSDNGVAAALAAGMICVKVAGAVSSGGATLWVSSLEQLDVARLRELSSSRRAGCSER